MRTEILIGNSTPENNIFAALENVTDIEFVQGMVLFYNEKTILLGVPQDKLIYFQNELRECTQ